MVPPCRVDKNAGFAGLDDCESALVYSPVLQGWDRARALHGRSPKLIHADVWRFTSDSNAVHDLRYGVTSVMNVPQLAKRINDGLTGIICAPIQMLPDSSETAAE